MISRRDFIASTTAGLAGLVLANDAAAQRSIYKLNDGSQIFDVVELYTDGVVLRENVNVGTQYKPDAIIFVRDGAGKSTEWGFRCTLYKDAAKAGSIVVDGTFSGGKLTEKTRTLPDAKQSPMEATLLEGAYHQSAMKMLSQRPSQGIEAYLRYFNYQLDQLRDGLTQKMPQGYNPLK